jgi:hypothetical protein
MLKHFLGAKIKLKKLLFIELKPKKLLYRKQKSSKQKSFINNQCRLFKKLLLQKYFLIN